MTFDEFKIQLARLRTEWKTAYGSEKELALYNPLKNFDSNAFEGAATELLMNHKGSAPTCNEIIATIHLNASQRQLKKGFQDRGPERDPRLPYLCERCGDSGYRFIEDEKGYERTYLCDCATARARPKRLFWGNGFTHEIPHHSTANKVRESKVSTKELASRNNE